MKSLIYKNSYNLHNFIYIKSLTYVTYYFLNLKWLTLHESYTNIDGITQWKQLKEFQFSHLQEISCYIPQTYLKDTFYYSVYLKLAQTCNFYTILQFCVTYKHMC